MGKILLEDIEVYAYHGHMPEERKTGARFLINLELDLDLDKASHSDKLEDTFDYARAYAIVKEEMAAPSFLLENVAGRILHRLLGESILIRGCRITISKLNPPFGGVVKAVAVELSKDRNT